MAVAGKQFKEFSSREISQNSLHKILSKAPLFLWRLGLRFMLPSSFACITTRGRNSGQPRYTMVEHYDIDGSSYIFSGWQANSQWVKNLLIDPDITIQPSHSRPIFGFADRVDEDTDLCQVFEEMQQYSMWRPWLKRLDIEPTIESFLANKDRVYIFQITFDGKMKLPPLVAELRWLSGVVLSGLSLVIAVILIATGI